MKINLPYVFAGHTKQMRLSKLTDLKFVLMQQFDVLELNETEAPLATSWKTLKNEAGEPAEEERSTRFFGGSHWLSLDAKANAAMKTLLKDAGNYSTCVEAMIELQHVFGLDSMQRTAYQELIDRRQYSSVVPASEVHLYEMNHVSITGARQSALFKARLHAHNLMICDQHVYQRCDEPRISLSYVGRAWRREEALIEIATSAVAKVRGVERQPQYEFRLDQEDEFVELFGEHPVSTAYEIVENFKDVTIWMPETLMSNFDLESLRHAARAIHSAISKANPVALSQEAMEYHRTKPFESMNEEELSAMLEDFRDNENSFAAKLPDVDTWRETLNIALDRRDLKPVSAFGL